MRRASVFAAALVALVAGAVEAQDTVRVRVGGDLTGRTGDTIEVPVIVDLTRASGRKLASYDLSLAFDTAQLQSVGAAAPGFATPVVGVLPTQVRATAALAAGAGGVVEAIRFRFRVKADTMSAPFTVSVAELTGTAPLFENLITVGTLVLQHGTFCRQRGRWGDADGDGQSTSRDALIALSSVVGLNVPAGSDPGLNDVDADGAVSSRDALIILSGAVGLPVTGFRYMLPAAGACATGAAISMTMTPALATLVPGQTMQVAVSAQDSSGRLVPTGGLTWRSSNATVAGYDPDSQAVMARGVGTTTITAELSPGVMASLALTVAPRRNHWYVAAAAFGRRGLTGDTGSELPFIGDAVRFGTSGDTIHVAPGHYPELVSAAKSFTIVGDSANRPLIDRRSLVPKPQFSSDTGFAMYLGEPSLPVRLEHLEFAMGGARIRGAGITVRRVRIHRVTGDDGLYLDAGPAPGQPRTPAAAGNVLVEYVRIDGPVEQEDGIEIRLGDTVVLRRDTVVGIEQGNEGCNSGDDASFRVDASTIALVEDNWADESPQNGIVAFADSSVTVRRNYIGRYSCAGAFAGGRRVAFDHNFLLNGGSRAGILIEDKRTDTLTSFGDSLGGSRGIGLDSVRVAIIDSLRADSLMGMVYAERDSIRLTLRDARVGYVDATFLYLHTRHANVEFRRNRIGRTFQRYLALDPWNYALARDTLLVVGDSVGTTGANAVEIHGTLLAQLDSLRVDSVYQAHGIVIDQVKRAFVRGLRIGSVLGGSGVDAYDTDTLTIRDSRIARANYGVVLNTSNLSVPRDTARMINVTVDTATTWGVFVSFRHLRLDSSTIRGDSINGHGVLVQNGMMVRLRRSVIEEFNIGVQLEGAGLLTIDSTRFSRNHFGVYNLGFPTLVPVTIRQSTFAGNDYSVYNGTAFATTVDADFNYWNRASGPICGTGVITSCPGTPPPDLDSIASDGVSFANFLTTPGPTPVPPAGLRAPMASRAVARAAAPAASPLLPASNLVERSQPRRERPATPRLSVAADPDGPFPAPAQDRRPRP